MTHKKVFASAGLLVVVAVFAVTVISLQHTPRALAEQLVNQGIGQIRTFDSGKMGEVQAQLGGDPTKELEEAKASKDLTVITKDELKAEAKKHTGVAMQSLGGDGPQFGSIGISSDGNGAPFEPPADAQTHFRTEAGETGGTSGSTRIESGHTESSEMSTQTRSTRATGTSTGGSAGQPAGPEVERPQPTKYLRYTNSTNHVVVLGLDDNGVPIEKTVFINSDEVQNIHGPGPRLNVKN